MFVVTAASLLEESIKEDKYRKCKLEKKKRRKNKKLKAQKEEGADVKLPSGAGGGDRKLLTCTGWTEDVRKIRHQ